MLEDQSFVGVFKLQIVKQLEPEILKLVGIVLEKLKVISHGGKDLIKLSVVISVGFCYQSDGLLLLCGVFSCHCFCNFINQVVFGGIIRQLISYSSDNVLNAVVKYL